MSFLSLTITNTLASDYIFSESKEPNQQIRHRDDKKGLFHTQSASSKTTSKRKPRLTPLFEQFSGNLNRTIKYDTLKSRDDKGDREGIPHKHPIP